MFTVGLNVIWFSKPRSTNITSCEENLLLVEWFWYPVIGYLKCCFNIWMLLSVEKRMGNFIQSIIPSWLTVNLEYTVLVSWGMTKVHTVLISGLGDRFCLAGVCQAAWARRDRECQSSQLEKITFCDWSRGGKLKMGQQPRWQPLNYTVPGF